MTHDLTGINAVAFAAQLVGAAGMIALGAFALTLRPRRHAAVGFGLFALGVGTLDLAAWATGWFHAPGDLLWLPRTPPALLLSVAGALMPLVFPSPVRPSERRRMVVAGGVALILLAFGIATILWRDFARTSRLVYEVAAVATTPLWIGALMLFALRFRHEPDAARRRTLALAATAFTIYLAFVIGRAFIATDPAGLDSVRARQGLAATANFVAIMLVGLLWLAATAGQDGHIARGLAWFTIGLTLLGMLDAATSWYPLGAVFFNSIAMVALLGYAVFKHQLLGLDAKVRFAISKSTVAAAFVAAFFLASEGAQILFGRGNEWVGLLAAGALVFVLAPLQRAAERLAERAVPSAAAASSSLDSARLTSYREATRYALRDGKLTRREEAHLVGLAEHLGIPASEAMRVRHEVEDEQRSLPSEGAQP